MPAPFVMLTVELPASAIHEIPVKVIVEPVSLRHVHCRYVPVAIVFRPSPSPGWHDQNRVGDPGIPKLRTAADDVPAFVTAGVEPAESCVTVPTEIVAAFPGAPVEPVSPLSPLGMVILNTAADDVPAFVTVTDDPAAPVVTVPTAIVAAVPAAPVAPVSPFAP